MSVNTVPMRSLSVHRTTNWLFMQNTRKQIKVEMSWGNSVDKWIYPGTWIPIPWNPFWEKMESWKSKVLCMSLLMVKVRPQGHKTRSVPTTVCHRWVSMEGGALEHRALEWVPVHPVLGSNLLPSSLRKMELEGWRWWSRSAPSSARRGPCQNCQ